MSACDALAQEASAGVGPALAAVDCLANEMAAGAFARLFGSEGSLLPVLTILLTLYIALFAFALITGRSQVGVSALTPRMVTLGVVLTFATSWMAWQQVVWNLAIGAPDQIAATIMGAKGPATRLFADRIDLVLGAIAQVGDAASGGDGAQAAQSSSGAFSPQGVMWLAAMLLLLGTVGVLVTARIALAVLLAAGPVFVVLGLFRQTRGLTAGWARGLVLTTIVPLFVVAGGSLMLELAVPVVAALDNAATTGQPGVNPRAAMALFLIAAVHCALMAMMLKVAGSITAAWQVFGLGVASAREDNKSVVTPAMPAAVMPAGASTAASGASASGAGRAALMPVMVADAPSGQDRPASGPAAGGGANRSVTNVVQAGATSGLPPLPRGRGRGIGSRFAAPRPTVAREIVR